MEATSPRLRVVVAAQRGLLAHVADVFTELHAQGAQLLFAAKTRNISRVKLPGGLLEEEGVSVQPLPLRRRGTSWEAVKLVRLLADYVRFLAGPWAPRIHEDGSPHACGRSGFRRTAPVLFPRTRTRGCKPRCAGSSACWSPSPSSRRSWHG